MARVLDLFSCIGNHKRGFDRAGQFETVAFVEANTWRRQKLAEFFPGIRVHDDVRTYQGQHGDADIVVGGPPCQKTSVAAAIHGRRRRWMPRRRSIGYAKRSAPTVKPPATTP